MSKINRTIALLKEFGFKLMVIKLIYACTKHIPKVKNITNKWKYKAIIKFLYKENKELINEFNIKNKKLVPKIIGKSNIWVLWWQGEKNAPDIVKMCLKSIRNHIGNKNLIVIDENNYMNFVKLENKYIEMMKDNTITLTQFSDLLRLNLLFQQGGLWIDATYLLTCDLYDCIWNLPFFTIRHGLEKEYPMSKGLWTSSVLGFYKGSPELDLVLKCYDNYFSKRTVLLDYLLTDYIFAACCDYSTVVKALFECVPVKNINVNTLLHIMNEQYTAETETIINETVMNKLSWKYTYIEKNSAGITVYGYLHNKLLNG